MRGMLCRASNVYHRAVEKDLEPGGEIHRRRIERHADVAKVAGAIARRNIHRPTERDREMGEIAAYADALAQAVGGHAARVRELIVEADAVVRRSRRSPVRASPRRRCRRTATRRSRRDCRCRNSGSQARKSSVSLGRSLTGVNGASCGVSSGSAAVPDVKSLVKVISPGGRLDPRHPVAEEVDVEAPSARSASRAQRRAIRDRPPARGGR